MVDERNTAVGAPEYMTAFPADDTGGKTTTIEKK
jgi:hypothetical protein